jgi:hypothetical protein
MPFHVEVRRSVHRAWAFNLDGDTLRRTVLEPWARGAMVRLGDRDWEPSKSALRVLEGRHLHPADLAHGQGWHHAGRDGRDVAHELLAATAQPASHPAGQAEARATGQAAGRATIVAVTDEQHEAVGALLDELAVTIVDWADVRPLLLARAGAQAPVQAALLVRGSDASADWHLDAGIALGALGPGVVAVALDAGAPAQIAGLRAIRIDGSRDAAVGELADRLRLAGCQVRPRPAPEP